MTSEYAETAAVADVGRPFWDALPDGKIMLQRCQACESVVFYAREWCPRCWSKHPVWFESAGAGVVWAATVSHVAFQGIDPSAVPFAVGLVDLDDGVRIPARFDVDSDVRAGDRVVATLGPQGLTFIKEETS